MSSTKARVGCWVGVGLFAASLVAQAGSQEEKITEASTGASIRAGEARQPSLDETGQPERVTERLEEILVTGSYIRGDENRTVPVQVYDREAIERRGYLTTQEFMRSLPQNFKGGENGVSEDGVMGSLNGLNNAIENASGVNLRGLGTSSTLVLLNGHRLAPSVLGSAVDISAIPLNAVERIEVLTDGASAIYGSDAVGGVVNFILRPDYKGAETILQAGTVTSGDRTQYVVGQTFGEEWGTGSALASVQYEEATALKAQDRSFTAELPEPNDLYPATDTLSGILTARQQLPGSFSLFTDLLYSSKRHARSYSALRNPARRMMGDTDFVSAHAGLGWNGWGGWRLEMTGLYSEVSTVSRYFFQSPQPGYQNGSPYGTNAFALREVGVVADGPLFELPAGSLRVALGATQRQERYEARVPWLPGNDRDVDRDVDAGFLQASLPVVSERNPHPFIRALELSASVRVDRYSDFGRTSNPKFGIFWQPTSQLGLRAAYGRSFHAPDVAQQIGNAARLSAFTFPFELPSGDVGPILVVSGNPMLKAERSEDFTAGLEFRPEHVPGVELSVNYYDIVYDDRLVTPPFDTAALLKPDVYGPLITEFSSDAAAQAYLDDLVSRGLQFIDLTGTGLTGVRYAYSYALTNASRVRQNGMDIGIAYAFTSGPNDIDMRLDATIIDKIQTGYCDRCSSVDVVNTFGQPLKKRARASLTWSRGISTLSAAVNYANSYSDVTVSPPGRLDSNTTVDLVLRLTPPFLSGGSIALSVLNAFDTDPPRTGAGIRFAGMHYDSANADPLGRFVSLQIRKTWGAVNRKAFQ